MINVFQNVFYYLENQRKHSVAYFVEEVFLSSITLVIYTKEISFDCKGKKGVQGFHFLNYKKNKEEETILNLKRFHLSTKRYSKFCTEIYVSQCQQSIVTRRGIRYIHFHSISLFGKSFSKYICDLVLVSFSETFTLYCYTYLKNKYDVCQR